MTETDSVLSVRLDIIGVMNVPSITLAELRAALERLELIGTIELAPRQVMPTGDLREDTLLVVELVTEGAPLEQILQAFRSADLQPGGIVDAVRLLLAGNVGGTPFPFMCLGDASNTKSRRSPVIDTDSDAMILSETVTWDDDCHRERGWTDHCFVPAHRLLAG